MKYIDADRLRAEIEKRKKTEGWCPVWKDAADVYYARGFRFACDFALSIIDSLQQEQPERICPRCVYHNKKEDFCECPYGGRDCFINENGIYKCNMFEEVEQQKQSEVDLEKEIDKEWENCSPIDEGMGYETALLISEQFHQIARHFYELGASVMRKRITNPEFNQKIIEKMKYECPVDEFNTRKEE